MYRTNGHFYYSYLLYFCLDSFYLTDIPVREGPEDLSWSLFRGEVMSALTDQKLAVEIQSSVVFHLTPS